MAGGKFVSPLCGFAEVSLPCPPTPPGPGGGEGDHRGGQDGGLCKGQPGDRARR